MCSFILKGWNSISRINYLINPKKKGAGYASNWTEEQEFFKKIVWGVFKKWKNLKNMCCAEAERAEHLRIDELSFQEQESKSAVNQLMVQIQERQDEMNSLNDSREFYDAETASTQCEPVSLNTGRLAERASELEGNPQNFATLTPRFARKFST